MSEASHHREEVAILLRSVAGGESDRLLTLLGEERGLFFATAKGARKSRRRFMGRLEPFTLGRFQTSRYHGRDYLDAVELIRGGERIGGDLGRYYLACYACEAVIVHLESEQPAPGVFSLLEGLLESASRAESFDDQVARAVFEAGFLQLQGLLPGYGPCEQCEADGDSEGLVLDATRGEWTCPLHAGGVGTGRVLLERADWDLLEQLQEQGFPTLPVPEGARARLRTVNRLTALLFLHQFPGRLRSATLLNAHQRAALHPNSPTS